MVTTLGGSTWGNVNAKDAIYCMDCIKHYLTK